MRYEFLVDTFATERLKTLGVWSQFTDHDLEFRPAKLARSVREHMVHQCLSEDGFFTKMLGLPVATTVLPENETCRQFIERYLAASEERLTSLRAQSPEWFEGTTRFFNVDRSRAWVLARRISHTAHHRGQLSTYHRLLGHGLYSIYGPTADTGGLPANGAGVIYRFASEEAVLENGEGPTLPGPGEQAPTERPGNHDLAFLHTLASNVDVFTPLVTERRPDLRIRHTVADNLLNEARKTGMTPDLAREVQTLMTDLSSTGARVVVCTCSTIGGAAEATDTGGRFVAMRIDRPMADRAVRLGPDVLVVAALASTFAPTRALLEDSARRANVPLRLEERLVDEAWPHFERGDRDAYYQAIADALATDLTGFGAVVLAQASMAPAADRCRNLTVPILSSPRLGVEAAVAILPPN